MLITSIYSTLIPCTGAAFLTGLNTSASMLMTLHCGGSRISPPEIRAVQSSLQLLLGGNSVSVKTLVSFIILEPKVGLMESLDHRVNFLNIEQDQHSGAQFQLSRFSFKLLQQALRTSLSLTGFSVSAFRRSRSKGCRQRKSIHIRRIWVVGRISQVRETSTPSQLHSSRVEEND